jgi:Fe-S-cluster containining protein
MQPVNLRAFQSKVKKTKKGMKRYLTKIGKENPRGLDALIPQMEREVWQEIDCLSCANCCKKMTPTFTRQDVKRIAAHLNMTPAAFTEKWLEYDKKDKDWLNVARPCQFLDTKTNMCSIYEVRPADCAGFPHLTKRKMKDYVHVHQQNIEYCPATYRLVEKMQVEIAILPIK